VPKKNLVQSLTTITISTIAILKSFNSIKAFKSIYRNALHTCQSTYRILSGLKMASKSLHSINIDNESMLERYDLHSLQMREVVMLIAKSI